MLTTTPVQDKGHRSCTSLYKSGARNDGVYNIDPDGFGSFQVRCDMKTDGGGWTVFQRRVDTSVDFYRGWHDYKNGFGDLDGNFWLGLDKIHRLSKSEQNALRVDLMDFTYDLAYAKYGFFSVASESDSYRLNVGSYSGNAGDSLGYHNSMRFSTYDQDNDNEPGSCATHNKGGWWYNACQYAHLNGRYFDATQGPQIQGIRWLFWKNDDRSMKKTEMKSRPALV
ncbi:fibrinogen C domain-containing protein 1-A-like isoform X2 [Dendronephthya gigantea]|nr:fibrinogen C domain-containing protein 1-A-like isoform X2 [Dendronephthya gigantea]